MPLEHSSSKPAFKRNVETLMHEVGKSPHVQSRQQALAIAYSVKRRGRAMGGVNTHMPNLGWQVRSEAHNMMHSGPISSIVGGRTDHHPMQVPAGSYVFPADHISSLGQGNTANGQAVLSHMFGMGPYGSAPGKITHGSGAPRISAPSLGKLASGGKATDESTGQPVPIYAAGGEFVLPPEKIIERFGNLDHGHKILDHWVKENRKKHISTLKKLPPPAKK